MNAIQKLIEHIFTKTHKGETVTELEWLLDIAYKDTGIDKGTINKAAAELARLTAIEQAAREFMQAADNVREWVETIDRTDSEDYNAKRVALAALLEKTK